MEECEFPGRKRVSHDPEKLFAHPDRNQEHSPQKASRQLPQARDP